MRIRLLSPCEKGTNGPRSLGHDIPCVGKKKRWTLAIDLYLYLYLFVHFFLF